ncbi:hypothetical protein IAU60_001683 [Kwoniella sp. DSM 27419]
MAFLTGKSVARPVVWTCTLDVSAGITSPFTARAYASSSRRPGGADITLRSTVRYHSSLPPKNLPPDQQTSYDRLKPVIDTFHAPVDWAVAYGSGVMKQAKTKPGDPPSLTDLLLSTPSATVFHSVNLRQNPSHYPLYARLIGGAGIGWAQEKLGAGVWYVTMVEINGVAVKYGVISTPTLADDLKHWNTLYLSGRLHKPVLPLLTPSSAELTSALETNLRSALSLSLLLCPETFEEDYLWEKIAGLSYSGDPRMSVPGAENPEKVKNIVRGPGAREGFREMYGPYLKEAGVSWEQGEKGDGWRGEGEGKMTQSVKPEHHAELFAGLPLNLRRAVSTHFSSAAAHLDAPNEKAEWIKPVQEANFRPIVAQGSELRKIIHGPALRQSIKGLLTAGPVKSFYYSLAKFRKWLKGRGGK